MLIRLVLLPKKWKKLYVVGKKKNGAALKETPLPTVPIIVGLGAGGGLVPTCALEIRHRGITTTRPNVRCWKQHAVLPIHQRTFTEQIEEQQQQLTCGILRSIHTCTVLSVCVSIHSYTNPNNDDRQAFIVHSSRAPPTAAPYHCATKGNAGSLPNHRSFYA